MRWIGLYVLLAAASGATPDTRLNVLTHTSRQVRALKLEDARSGYPVHLRGLVTYAARTRAGSFFFQDASGGVYVESVREGIRVRPGQQIELRGRTAPGHFRTNIRDAEVRILRQGRWPSVRPSTFDELASGNRAAEWVEIEGVVRSAGVNRRTELELLVGSGRGEFRAYVLDHPPVDPSRFVDAVVRIRGVCGATFNKRRQFTGFRLRVPSLDHVTIKRAASADPFAIRVVPVSRLLQFAGGLGPRHRVRVQGEVTFQMLGQALAIRDRSQPLYIGTQQTTPVRPGDRVDVVGFVAVGEYSPVLRNAVFRKIGEGSRPAPLVMPAEQAAGGDADGDLIRVEGVLLDRVRQTGSQRLVLQAGKVVFNAELPEKNPAADSLTDLAQGSRLAVTGICIVEVDDNQNPIGFRLLLRGPDDVAVLARPSWWTLGRLIHVLVIMGALMLAAAVWLSVLRRRVARQTRVIRERLEREAALEQRYRDLVENAIDLVCTLDTGRPVHVSKRGRGADHRLHARRSDGDECARPCRARGTRARARMAVRPRGHRSRGIHDHYQGWAAACYRGFRPPDPARRKTGNRGGHRTRCDGAHARAGRASAGQGGGRKRPAGRRASSSPT